MTTYINNQTWTAADGSTPANLVLGYTPTAGSVTVQTNRVDFKTGSTGGYSSADRVNRCLSSDGTTALNLADIDLTISYTVGNSDNYPEIVARSTQTVWDGATGYILAINGGTLSVTKAVSYTYTTLASVPFTWNVGTTYLLRYRVVGTSISVYAGTTLPGTPNLSVTDSGISAAGKIVINVNPQGSSTATHAYFDTLTVTDGTAGATVVATRLTTWRVGGNPVSTRGTTWRVLKTAAQTRATTWNTRVAVVDTQSTTWNTAAPVQGNRRTWWQVAQLATPGRFGMRLRVYLPNGADQGILPAPNGVDVAHVLNDTGTLSVAYAVSAPRSSLLGQPCELAVEVSPDGGINWLEPPNGRFVYQSDGVDPVSRSAAYQVTGISYVWRLETAKVLPTVAGKDLLNADGKRPFLSVTPGTILKTLLGEAQSRGALTGISHSSFTTTTDSAGVAWGSVVTIYYDPGVSYLTVLRDLADQGFVDFQMQGRSLQVFRPATVLGSDLTVGTAQTTLRVGRDVLEAPVTRTWEALANYAYFAGLDTAKYEMVNAAAVTPWGRQEMFISNGTVSDSGTMVTLTQAELAQTDDVRISYTHTLDFARAAQLPIIDYSLGDFVWAATSSTDGAPLVKLRVRQVTLNLDEYGRTTGNVVLNDRFVESDIRMKRRIEGITNGATSGPGTGGPVTAPNKTPPAKVGTISLASSAYTVGPTPLAMVHLSWPAVTTNSDGTAADDIDHYDVFQRPFGSATNAQKLVGASSDNVHDLSGYLPGSSWWFSVRAVDDTGNVGARSDERGITMALKDTPPAAPTTPTVTTRLGIVTVAWNGALSVGTLPPDFKQVDVHASTVSNFTPTSATLIGTLFGAGVVDVMSPTQNVPLYARLVARDTSNNSSTPSAQASATPSPLLGTDFAKGSIGYNQIAFKDPGNIVPDGSFETQAYRDAVLAAPITDESCWAFTQSFPGLGAWSARADALVNPGVTSYLGLVVDDDQTIRPGEKLFLRMMSRGEAGSNGNVGLQVLWHDATGALLSTSEVVASIADATWRTVSGYATAPANCSGFQLVAFLASSATGGAWQIDALEARRTVATAIIEDAAITTAKIASLAVTDAQIANLNVAKIVSGTVSADLLVAGTLKTASSGSRVELSSTGLRLYSGSTLVYDLAPSNGYAQFYNTGDVSLTSTTHAMQIGPTSGQNMIFDNNEIMSRNNAAVSGLYLNASGGPIGLGAAAVMRLYASNTAFEIANEAAGTDSSVYWTSNQVRIISPGLGTTYRAILASAFTVSSARAVKQDITDFDPMTALRQAKAHRFRYKNNLDDGWHFGPMADDLPEELVRVASDGEVGVDLNALTGVLWEAVRRLADRVEKLEGRHAKP